MTAERSPGGPGGPGGPGAWSRLAAALRPRLSKGQLVGALLCALLGFAGAVQVRSTQTGGLGALRESELVGVLDSVSEQSRRLQEETQQLERTRADLASGSSSGLTALKEARQRADTLAVLAGTAPATGPGIVVTIPDPRGEVEADVLLDAVQELRDAGAEALQVGAVRVVASSYFVPGADGGIVVDGTVLHAPYRLLAIGDPTTLASALDIPGGVRETLRSQGSRATVRQRPKVDVTALRVLRAPQYARPAPEATG